MKYILTPICGLIHFSQCVSGSSRNYGSSAHSDYLRRTLQARTTSGARSLRTSASGSTSVRALRHATLGSRTSPEQSPPPVPGPSRERRQFESNQRSTVPGRGRLNSGTIDFDEDTAFGSTRLDSGRSTVSESSDSYFRTNRRSATLSSEDSAAINARRDRERQKKQERAEERQKAEAKEKLRKEEAEARTEAKLKKNNDDYMTTKFNKQSREDQRRPVVEQMGTYTSRRSEMNEFKPVKIERNAADIESPLQRGDLDDGRDLHFAKFNIPLTGRWSPDDQYHGQPGNSIHPNSVFAFLQSLPVRPAEDRSSTTTPVSRRLSRLSSTSVSYATRRY